MTHFILMTGGGEGGGGFQLLFLLFIFVIFYFFMIRPQMKKSKDQKKFRSSIGKGDKIVTIGGVHGKIIDMDETTCLLEMVDKTRIKIERSAISMENSQALAGAAGAKPQARKELDGSKQQARK